MGIRLSVYHQLQKIRRRAAVWTIKDKVRKKATGLVRLQDFELDHAGSIEMAYLAQAANISLYTLDHHRREAVFVETPAEVDLTQFPFLYQAQYEHAQRVLTLPYALFFELTAPMGAQKPVVFIHSVGRCGSTLLSNVFNNVAGVLSLSEPDAFTGIVRSRHLDGSNQEEMVALTRSIIQMHSRPTPQLDPEMVVIKFRSFSTTIIDLLHEAAPGAHHIFLYRHAADHARSAARAFKAIEAGKEIISHSELQRRIKFVPLLQRPDYSRRALAGELSQMEMNMLGWLAGMEKILEVQQAEIPIIPVRYEDMIAYPEVVVKKLFAVCGIPETAVARGVQAFARDSQQGSPLSRDKLNADRKNQFTTEHAAQLHQLLAEHPRINDADFRIPHTISVNGTGER